MVITASKSSSLAMVRAWEKGPDKFSLKVHRRGAIRRDVKDVDLGPWEEKAGAAPDQELLPLDKRIFLIPRANVLVTIPTPNNRLVVHRFRWDTTVKEKEKVILVATPLPMRDEKAFVTAQLKANGELFRVPLEKGKTYNVFVKGTDFSPAVQIQDGATVLVAKRAPLNVKQILMSFTAKRTDEYYVRVDPQGPGVKSDFQLTIAATMAQPPQSWLTRRRAACRRSFASRIRSVQAMSAPSQYLLKLQVGTEYSIKVGPIRRLSRFDKERCSEMLETRREHRGKFKAPQTGEFACASSGKRGRVSAWSRSGMLGADDGHRARSCLMLTEDFACSTSWRLPTLATTR